MYVKDAQQHACEMFPQESCGVVVEEEYICMENVADDPITTFTVDPEAFAHHMISGKLQAVIHSHPNGPAYPTASDMRSQIETNVPWGIVVVEQRTHPAAKETFWFGGDDRPPLVGRGFRHGVTDCYSLIRDWYHEDGIELPEVPRNWRWWETGETLYEAGFEKAGFEKVGMISNPKVGDVFFAQIKSKTPNHAGVYVGNGLILHHLSGRSGYSPHVLSVQEPVTRYSNCIRDWLRRV